MFFHLGGKLQEPPSSNVESNVAKGGGLSLCSTEKVLYLLWEPAGYYTCDKKNQNQKLYEATWGCEFRVCYTVFNALRVRSLCHNL